MTEATQREPEPRALYWNRTGRIACDKHAPPKHGKQWVTEAWIRIPYEWIMRGALHWRPQCDTCGEQEGGEQ